MNIIGNILWIIFGGWLTALVWCFFGALACLSIVGLPWGRACFVMAGFAFLPFGYESISREVLYGKKDIGTGVPGTIGNVIWFIFAGLWIALGHIGTAVAQALTIIGIPFGIQAFKFARLSLLPFGKVVCTDFDKHPILNILWNLLGGMIMVLLFGVLMIVWFVTIIGIPFGKQFFKLARLSALPYGATVEK